MHWVIKRRLYVASSEISWKFSLSYFEIFDQANIGMTRTQEFYTSTISSSNEHMDLTHHESQLWTILHKNIGFAHIFKIKWEDILQWLKLLKLQFFMGVDNQLGWHSREVVHFSTIYDETSCRNLQIWNSQDKILTNSSLSSPLARFQIPPKGGTHARFPAEHLSKYKSSYSLWLY